MRPVQKKAWASVVSALWHSQLSVQIIFLKRPWLRFFLEFVAHTVLLLSPPHPHPYPLPHRALQIGTQSETPHQKPAF